MKKGIIRILQSLMGGGGENHKNITEPHGGGDHKNITEPYGGDHKNITEPYGISGKFHRTQPKTSDPPPGDKL